MWAKTGHSTDNDPVSAVCQHWERVLAGGERERETESVQHLRPRGCGLEAALEAEVLCYQNI